MIKAYPRARISRHPALDGWVIDLLQRENAKPKRVAATYSTIPWAYKAAQSKIPKRPAASTLTPRAASPQPKDAGTCGTCNRPMRFTGSKAADHPGTVLRQRADLCQSCCKKDER